jgi:hypothetical protein
VIVPGLIGQDPGFHRDARLPQPRHAAAIGSRIGIPQRHDHPRHRGADQRLGTGRGLAKMIAGLQRDINSGAVGLGPGLRQRTGSACGRPPGWVQPRPGAARP